MRRFFLLILVIIIFTFSCAQQQNYPNPNYPKKIQAKNSATEVVLDFLLALKERDFSSAYKQIYIVSSDEKGYVSRFESIYDEYDLRIISYRVLGTQLYKDSAIVVVEVEVDYKLPSSDERIKTIYRSQYDLAVIEELWKITKDKCIENCRDAPSNN